MTNTPRFPSLRKWAQLAFGATIIFYGVVGFPTPSDPEPSRALADCDALGHTHSSCYNRPDPETPPPPPQCKYGGTFPNCNSRPPNCAYGGTYPNCNSKPSECAGLNTPQCKLVQGGTLLGCSLGSTSSFCQQVLGSQQQEMANAYNSLNPDNQIQTTQTCANGIHGDNCRVLLELGVDPELLQGSGGGNEQFADAQQTALQTCKKNPRCNYKKMEAAWEKAGDDYEDQDPVHRGTQASALCEGFSNGNVPCNPETDDETIELVQWMCGQGYTTGYTGNCGSITTIEQAEEEFGQGKPMTQAQSWSFNGRTLEEVGYVQPFGYTTGVNRPGSHCLNGLTVMQAHVATDDDGCRPPQCDFGRAAEGWCLPPSNTTPPIIYITGEDVDEDAGTTTFRLALSHVSSQTIGVTVSTSDGTATAGTDYEATNRRVTFRPRTSSSVVSVPITDDTTNEADETFTLTMSGPSSNAELSTSPQAEATIIDDDESPPSAVRNLTVDCSSVGVDGEVTVTWMAPGEGSPNGYYSRLDGPDSYRETKYNVPAGTTEHTFDGAPGWGDYTATVYGYLLHGDGPTTTATQTCQPSSPMVALSDTTLTVEEGSSVQITATLDKAPASTASVGFTLSGGINGNGSCSAVSDFWISDTRFTFTDTATASITLTACDDIDTTDDTVTLALTTIGISGLQLGSPTTVVVSIADDDTAQTPVVSLTSTMLAVDEMQSIQVTASLDMVPSNTASVRFTLSGATNGNGSCSAAGTDFYVSDTEFTFTNATSASVTFHACDDTDTTDETVTLVLTTLGITELQLGSPTRVVVTIADDDTAPAPLLK